MYKLCVEAKRHAAITNKLVLVHQLLHVIVPAHMAVIQAVGVKTIDTVGHERQIIEDLQVAKAGAVHSFSFGRAGVESSITAEHCPSVFLDPLKKSPIMDTKMALCKKTRT